MVEEPIVEWVAVGDATPPMGERLLLIFSAAGDPADGQGAGHSEICFGYWTGERFRATEVVVGHRLR